MKTATRGLPKTPRKSPLREDASLHAGAGQSQQARSGAAHAMTIDVEDYFQVEAFASTISRSEWERLPRRVERNTERLLDILAESAVQATFLRWGGLRIGILHWCGALLLTDTNWRVMARSISGSTASRLTPIAPMCAAAKKSSRTPAAFLSAAIARQPSRSVAAPYGRMPYWLKRVTNTAPVFTP